MGEKFKTVTVIGAGTMGHGIGLLFALGGCSVRLVDLSRERLDRALKLIESHLDGLKLHREYGLEADAVLARITPECGLDESLPGVDLVVEAVVEKAAAKRELFQHLGRRLGADALVASTTSYMDVFSLAPEGLQARLLIAHFYNPAYIIPLVELVPGPKTDPAAVVRLRNFLETLKLTCISMKKYIPGFIINRLQRALGREIFHLIDAGIADPAEIDRAAKASLAIRLPVMGVVARYDFAGLDATLNNIKGEPVHLASGSDRSPTLERLVAEGRLGVKTGRGFFDWSGRELEDLLRQRDLRLLQVRRLMQEWIDRDARKGD
ncbi:MAG: 3-hydroxyacyl-CoA dehydrogenase family protein [Desulfobacterales bacterium]|jgi:3-hydroxybutyryl-CoA dehydrogenase|nr:3-hydroxyacyl-CoA dehydrogenase family protein [Desulfobacterales bacterium]